MCFQVVFFFKSWNNTDIPGGYACVVCCFPNVAHSWRIPIQADLKSELVYLVSSHSQLVGCRENGI